MIYIKRFYSQFLFLYLNLVVCKYFQIPNIPMYICKWKKEGEKVSSELSTSNFITFRQQVPPESNIPLACPGRWNVRWNIDQIIIEQRLSLNYPTKKKFSSDRTVNRTFNYLAPFDRSRKKKANAFARITMIQCCLLFKCTLN
mgnify:CR=1 FL=1